MIAKTSRKVRGRYLIHEFMGVVVWKSDGISKSQRGGSYKITDQEKQLHTMKSKRENS